MKEEAGAVEEVAEPEFLRFAEEAVDPLEACIADPVRAARRSRSFERPLQSLSQTGAAEIRIKGAIF
jgi:hypothetical protein